MPKPAEFTQQITFLHSKDLRATQRFYADFLGLSMARDQGVCKIFKVNNGAFLGFCEHIEQIEPGRKVILTLVCDDVDGWYEKLQNTGAEIVSPPKNNPKYQIYHFFLKDPDGYWVEIQRFEEPLSV
jgi:predicted enzyme related to lactoylglutathione lyase